MLSRAGVMLPLMSVRGSRSSGFSALPPSSSSSSSSPPPAAAAAALLLPAAAAAAAPPFFLLRTLRVGTTYGQWQVARA